MKKSLYLKGYLLKSVVTNQSFVSMPPDFLRFILEDEWDEVQFFCGGCYE